MRAELLFAFQRFQRKGDLKRVLKIDDEVIRDVRNQGALFP
jgi:hypothetical protein